MLDKRTNEANNRVIFGLIVVVIAVIMMFVIGVSPISLIKDLFNYNGDEFNDPKIYEDNETVEEISTEITYENFFDNIPLYEGQNYVVVNDDYPFFTDEDRKVSEPFEYYSLLDRYKRCGPVMALISQDGTMPETNERTIDISDIKPSGWSLINTKDRYGFELPDGSFYLYNRCHLLAYCLGAGNEFLEPNNSAENLITGTRHFNLVMRMFESGYTTAEGEKVKGIVDYLEDSGNPVLFRCTPYYNEFELVPRGVLMEAESLTNKKAFHLCVFIYNVQPGWHIDYNTGVNSFYDPTQIFGSTNVNDPEYPGLQIN